LMMATPPFFQWLFGAPNVRMTFTERQDGIAKFLSVHVNNEPVKSRLLQWLKVRTDLEYIRAFANVFHESTGQAVAHRSGIEILPEHNGAFYALIAHAVSPTRDLVSSIEIQSGQARTTISTVMPHIPLPPGSYR